MKTINNTFNQLYETINQWLLSLQRTYGIEPNVSLAIIAIVLILIILICAITRRKRIKRIEKQNLESVQSLTGEIEQVRDNIQYVNNTLANTQNRLDQVEEFALELDGRLEEAEQTMGSTSENSSKSAAYEMPANRDDNFMGKGNSIKSDIIYIDCRQGGDTAPASVGEVKDTLQSVLSGLVEKETNNQRQEKIEEDFKEPLETEPAEVQKEAGRAIYTSRTSGVSKSGTEYTVEQLNQQIKD